MSEADWAIQNGKQWAPEMVGTNWVCSVQSLPVGAAKMTARFAKIFLVWDAQSQAHEHGS